MKEIFAKTKKVLLDPRSFFKGLKENKINGAFYYLAFWNLVRLILGLIIAVPVQNFLNNFLPRHTSSVSSFPLVILGYIISLLLGFVAALFLHIWIKIFGGKGTFTQTYQLYVYSDTPNFLFGLLPIVNIITRVYGLIILIVGTQEVHKIGQTKSILMYVIPAVIIILLVIVGAIAAISTLLKLGVTPGMV